MDWDRDLHFIFFFPLFNFCQMLNQSPQYHFSNNPFFPHYFEIELLYILE